MEPDGSRAEAWEGPGPEPARLLELLAGLAGFEGDDPGPLFGPLLEGLLDAFGADRALILEADPDAGASPLAARVRAGSPRGAADPLSKSLVRAVLADRRARVLTSLETAELRRRVASLPDRLASILVAPVELPAGPGLLYLDGVLERRRFGEADRTLLAAFATALGGALELAARARREAGLAARLAALAGSGDAPPLLGDAPAYRDMLRELDRAAAGSQPVLLEGEAGTGRETLARRLHARGARAGGPFVAIRIPALPAELLAPTLFGHEKGAFTGATEARPGRWESADGGTLYLEGIDELPLPAQALLLRVLQEKRVRRVGGSRDLPLDFRAVAAAGTPLETAVRAGRFREDLYFRLAGYRVRVPPLRERGDDVLLLAEAWVAREARALDRPAPGLTADAVAALRAHRWPGNLPELARVVRRAVLLAPPGPLGAESLGPELAGPREVEALAAYPSDLEAARRHFEVRLLKTRLAAAAGDLGVAAAGLGVSRRRLRSRCRELGLEAPAEPD